MVKIQYVGKIQYAAIWFSGGSRICQGGGDHGECVENGGLGVEPPAGSRGRAPGGGSGGRSPPEAESFLYIFTQKSDQN